MTDELANGIAKRLVELKRSMEATFMCTNQAAQTEVSTSDPYLTGSPGQIFRARTGTSKLALVISSFYLSVGFVILMLVMTTAALEAVRYFTWLITGKG